MRGSHLNMFIWQGVFLLVLFILSLLVRLPLSTRKGRCALGQEGSGSPPIVARELQDGPLEVRRVACGTDSLLSRPLRLVPPGLPEGAACQFWGARGCWQRLRGSACATSGCHTPECRGRPSGAFPRGESQDRATSASLHPLPVPRRRVGPCWRLRAQILLRALEWGQEAGALPKVPFFLLRHLPLWLPSRFVIVPWVCLEAARNPALTALQCLQASPPPHPWLSETFHSP